MTNAKLNKALRETIHILAQHSPLCKDIEESREKLMMLGLNEEQADAMIMRELHGGFEFDKENTNHDA